MKDFPFAVARGSTCDVTRIVERQSVNSRVGDTYVSLSRGHVCVNESGTRLCQRDIVYFYYIFTFDGLWLI